MRQYRVKDRREVHELITAALSELGRSYTPFNYGVVKDQSTGGQIIYFDLPVRHEALIEHDVHTSAASRRAASLSP